MIIEESGFSWHHASGWVALVALGTKEMFTFLGKIWPKQSAHQNGNGSAAMELKLSTIVKDAVQPLHESIKGVSEKLDKHIQWHLEKAE